jgi:hypothetical protein
VTVASDTAGSIEYNCSGKVGDEQAHKPVSTVSTNSCAIFSDIYLLFRCCAVRASLTMYRLNLHCLHCKHMCRLCLWPMASQSSLLVLQGEMPSDCESASINAALATAATSNKLCWLNPFATPARVRVQLHSREQAGTFSLKLPGAETMQQQQPKTAAAGADVRGLQCSSTSSSSGATGHQNTDSLHADERQDPITPSDQWSEDGYDQLERQSAEDAAPAGDSLAGLLAAVTGTAPSWANKGSSSNEPHSRPAASSRQQQQQHQQPHQQVVLQQSAEVTVAPNSQLQLPVSFCPQLLKEAAAEISVSLVSPAVPSPEPLVWRYEVRGLAHADARGVKFAVKCKAKQSVEEVLTLPLPGLDPAIAAAASAAATSQQQQQQGPSSVKFSHELVIPDQHQAALAAALSVEQLDQLPVLGLPGAEAAPVLRLRLHFAPQKAVAAVVPLAVSCSTGARWVYDVNLAVSSGVQRPARLGLHWQATTAGNRHQSSHSCRGVTCFIVFG